MSALEFDPSRDREPFLRLPAPLDTIILTPPRASDGDAAIRILNDPRVYMYLQGTPFPYTVKDREDWYEMIKRGYHRSLSLHCPQEVSKIQQSDDQTIGPWDGDAPVRAIREVIPQTGEQIFLGDISLHRCTFQDILDEDEQRKLKKENDAWPEKDERIVWEFGYYLDPSQQGRGIMTKALETLLHAFALPDLNAHKFKVYHFGNNIGSRRVFEKNGFVHEKIVSDAITLSESRGGGKVDLGVLTWTRK